MRPTPLQFLIPSLPGDIARSYLKRTFGWQLQTDHSQTVTLFVRYCRNGSAEIYETVVEMFPETCRLVNASENEAVFLLCASPIEFVQVLERLSSSGHKQTADEIRRHDSPPDTPEFKIRSQIWRGDRPRIMGILNVTPDSFYDGGRYFPQADYTETVQQMIDAGADVIDIGGESSRPGAAPVSEEEELERVLGVIEQVRHSFDIPLSIDTKKPAVADAALAAGADMVNDISGLASGLEMINVVRRHDAAYCLMHIQGTPQTMQENPRYHDVIGEILRFFHLKLGMCADAGLEKERILLDPGIGFGKTVLNNIDILRLLYSFTSLGCLILLGTSNKSFLGKTLDRDLDSRVAGTMATQALGWTQGASVFRVHQVREARDTLEIARMCTRDVALGHL